MSEERSLVDITLDLGVNHEVTKTAKKDLEKSRGEFFEAATEALEEGVLAKRTVEAPFEDQVQIAVWVERWHPGWRIVSIEDTSVQLEEDPAKKKFVFVNPDDGQVYQRNAVQGQPSIDDERLKDEDPDLWNQITRPIDPPGLDLLTEYCKEYDQESNLRDWIVYKQESDEWPRVLLPAEEMPDEALSKITDYLVPSAISLRLESPRAAKPEELDPDE